MPALDLLISGGAIHIADQNKQTPIKTLCGQALDKESTRYLMDHTNFSEASCKVCRSIYFDESWAGETRSEPIKADIPPVLVVPLVEENEPQGETIVRKTLFAGLQRPVNSHTDDLNEFTTAAVIADHNS